MVNVEVMQDRFIRNLGISVRERQLIASAFNQQFDTLETLQAVVNNLNELLQTCEVKFMRINGWNYRVGVFTK